MIEQILEHILM